MGRRLCKSPIKSKCHLQKRKITQPLMGDEFLRKLDIFRHVDQIVHQLIDQMRQASEFPMSCSFGRQHFFDGFVFFTVLLVYNIVFNFNVSK